MAQSLEENATEAALRKMARAIEHRGPDDSGVWVDASACVGFGHRRLSVLELSPAGAQPMHSRCGRYVIAFNGEIYNHMALRASLEKEQWDSAWWDGHSDTETLLVCFSAWGIEATLRATVGMFAIALWDNKLNELTLARDRVGEKPLYWGQQNGVLLFGSELKALKQYPGFQANVNRNSLALFLRHCYIPAPDSIYENVWKLPPGHYMTVDARALKAGAFSPKAYWSMQSAVTEGVKNRLTDTEAGVINTLEHTLKQSVSQQMLADVPLGAFLSGGVDSSLIVSLMQSQSARPVRTFAVGFDEEGYNEAEHASRIARHLRMDHAELYVNAKDALNVIPSLPAMFCEPFADSSQVPMFLVSKMAREHVTVCLSGDGGDELFGGYNPYRFGPKVWAYISKFPRPLRKMLADVLSGVHTPPKIQKLVEVMPAERREEFYRLMQSHWVKPEQVVLGAVEPETLMTQSASWPSTESYAHWMMAVDAGMYMPDDILVKVDRSAMANSLETRVPMLDHRVVELAWRIPMSMKIRDGKGKWALREVLYRHVPRELIDRPKKGFSIPVGKWLRGPLREWAESLLDKQRLRDEGYFNVDEVHNVWKRHMAGKRDYSTRLWSILMFQAWLDEQTG